MELDDYDEHTMNVFCYKNRNNNDIIVKNNKTHVYESFDKDGNVIYKLVLVRKEEDAIYFKLTNDKYVIKYDVITKNMYKMTIYDFYEMDDSNNIYFDNKLIVL